MTWGPVHVVANWKMHGTTQACQRLIAALRSEIEQRDLTVSLQERVMVHICPPAPYLSLVGHMLQGQPLQLGAQDMHFEENGPFTGAVGAQMLNDLGCGCVIVGHSERRAHFQETPEQIGLKIAKAVSHDIIPILCVGESLADQQAGTTFAVILKQICASLAYVPAGIRLFIAYEPLWAIGAGTTPRGVDVNQLCQLLSEEKQLQKYKIDYLYGGSVTPDNIHEFISQPCVNGVLVGGVSLYADRFAALLAVAGRVVLQPKQTQLV